jgi:hypothetical protein
MKEILKTNFLLLRKLTLGFTTDGKRNVLLSAKPISMDLTAGLEMKYVAGKDIDFAVRTGVGNLTTRYR